MKKRTSPILVVVVIFSLLLLAGCGVFGGDDSSDEPTVTPTATMASGTARPEGSSSEPEATRALTHSAASSALGDDLTEREREALALIVHGKSNEEIAELMVISLSTAKRHVSVCISKLGASNRAQAAALAVQHSLVPDPA